jgi:sugar O-acyltransferase (sialic acid O-acetyltransferase NeuD family)
MKRPEQSMYKVVIIGAGGHAAEIDDYISYNESVNENEKLSLVGFLDDNPDSYKSYDLSAPYLGPVKDHQVSKGVFYIMGIANIKYRRIIIEEFLKRGAKFLSLIHQSAYISRSASVGAGSIIGPHVNLGPNVKVGNYNLINSRCSLGHDTVLGDFNFISPNVCFSGFTRIEDENLFGINSATIPNIRIGSSNKISAGMIVDQDIKNEEVVFHRFKEKVIAVPKR